MDCLSLSTTLLRRCLGDRASACTTGCQALFSGTRRFVDGQADAPVEVSDTTSWYEPMQPTLVLPCWYLTCCAHTETASPSTLLPASAPSLESELPRSSGSLLSALQHRQGAVGTLPMSTERGRCRQRGAAQDMDGTAQEGEKKPQAVAASVPGGTSYLSCSRAVLHPRMQEGLYHSGRPERFEWSRGQQGLPSRGGLHELRPLQLSSAIPESRGAGAAQQCQQVGWKTA